MSSVRTVTVVAAGVDPFARRRTVTNPLTGERVGSALLTGPVTVTVPLGLPGRDGAAAIPELIDCGGPNNTTGA